VRELEALAQARDAQLAEVNAKAGALEVQVQLQKQLIEASMSRLDEFLNQQNRRLSTRITNLLFWTRGPRP